MINKGQETEATLLELLHQELREIIGITDCYSWCRWGTEKSVCTFNSVEYAPCDKLGPAVLN